MSPVPVVVVNDDRSLQAQLEHCLADIGFESILKPWPADSPTSFEQEPPVAVVVNLPSDGPPQQEQVLLARLHDDPAIRQVPVLVCSDRPAILQSAVTALQPRPGVVIASAPDAEELVAKLRAAQEAKS